MKIIKNNSSVNRIGAVYKNYSIHKLCNKVIKCSYYCLYLLLKGDFGGCFILLKGYSHRNLRQLTDRFFVSRGKRTISISNVKIIISVNDYMDSFETEYAYKMESAVITKFMKELRSDDVVWDVGANLGIYSLFAAKSQKITGIAFEPHPTTVARLRENIELNRVENIEILPIALSDSKDRAHFYPDGIQSSSGRAHLATGETKGTIQVEASRGDDLIEPGNVPEPDVVKIDVEGAEHLVVKGMEQALSRCRVLFCEVHPQIGRYGSSAADLETTLQNLGFTLEKIQDRVDKTYTILGRNNFSS